MILLGFALAVARIAACQSIQSDHIYARDLAAVVPVFGSIAPDRQIALAPLPGQRRVFHSAELTRIAATFRLTTPIEDEACFEWLRHLPAKEDIQKAMTRSLEGTGASVDVIELPANFIPNGELSFPLTGIAGSSDGPVTWRGTVTYAPNRVVPVWARVRITAHGRRVVALHALQPTEPVTAEALRVEDYTGPFRREKYLSDPQQVVGLMPRATIPAGTAITTLMLRDAIAVERGDTVQVIVEIARTRVETEGIADESGPRGAVIVVRNPKSGRKFRARVEARDKVLVLPTSMAGLAVEKS